MNRIPAPFFLAAIALIAAAPCVQADDANTASNDSAVVAKIGPTTITEKQMREEMGLSLYNAENQLYMTKKAWLNNKARDILFDKAAKAAGMKRSAWEAKEIAVSTPTAKDVDDLIHRMVPAGQVPTDPQKLAEMHQQATQYLMNQRKNQKEQEVYQRLTQADPVQIVLAPPNKPSISVTYSKDSPVRGPKDAPVTVVEFTDFQCPWCKKSQDNVSAVEKQYGDKVKFVARNFPLTQIHPRAMPAAEAAYCAKEQGKYWEYRDKLFEKQELSDADFKRYASELNLNAKKFDKCLAGHKGDAFIQNDMADGQKFGVSGTPSFFVNNRPVSAMELEGAVKDELGGSTAAPAPAKKS